MMTPQTVKVIRSVRKFRHCDGGSSDFGPTGDRLQGGLEWGDIEAREGGVDHHPDSAVGAIRRAAETKRETWIHMAEKARRYAEQRLDIRVTAEQVWNAVTGCVDHE